MRAIHVSVRVAPVHGALSHGDHGSLLKVLHHYCLLSAFQSTAKTHSAKREAADARHHGVSNGNQDPPSAQSHGTSASWVSVLLVEKCVVGDCVCERKCLCGEICVCVSVCDAFVV